MAKRPGDRNKEALKLVLCSFFGIENVATEWRFHPDRRWRFDLAVPSILVAVEYNGHGHTGGGHIGRHATIIGMSGDAEKLNQAQLLGWRVFQFTALHFDARAREKHKLTDPSAILSTLENQ